MRYLVKTVITVPFIKALKTLYLGTFGPDGLFQGPRRGSAAKGAPRYWALSQIKQAAPHHNEKDEGGRLHCRRLS